MKANELRIGNWVTVIGNFEQIEEISKYYFETKSVISMCSDEETEPKPIPLTEEILLKCGFKKINAKYHRKGALTIEVNLHNHFTISLLGKSIVNYKHLHQLQNLYFALTGEELEINI